MTSIAMDLSNSTSTSPEISLLRRWFPSAEFPLICSAPMRGVSGVKLAVEVSRAGGIGFLGAGYEIDNLAAELAEGEEALSRGGDGTRKNIGVGFIQWACPLSAELLAALVAHPPSCIWLFAPSPSSISPPSSTSHGHLHHWLQTLTNTFPPTTPRPPIIYQTSLLTDAISALQIPQPYHIDILCIQSTADSGGHGIRSPAPSASLIVQLPELLDSILTLNLSRPVPVLAAGGICDSRGVAAALALGAHGVVMGTRFIASEEAIAKEGYKKLVVEAKDGGVSTVETRVYDKLRGTNGWPEGYSGRGVMNKSYVEWRDGEDNKGGADWEEVLRRKYKAAEEAGDFQRLTAYAGTGVGLVNEILPAGVIVREAREGAKKRLAKFSEAGW